MASCSIESGAVTQERVISHSIHFICSTMFTNYLKIAFRSLLRQKSYAAINIVGLALGIVCSLLMVLHIADDLAYDRFHSKRDRIYRFTQWNNDGQVPANTAPAWAEALTSDIPQIEAAVRFYENSTETLMSVGETKFYEKRLKFADANVFEVFDFPLVEGDARTALVEPFTIVLSESAAKRYFGKENPVGKFIRYDNKRDFRVTGVIRDVPSASHLQFDMLGSMETVKRDIALPDGFKSFFWNPFLTYILVREEASSDEIMPLLWQMKNKYMKDVPVVPGLQALTDIHLIHEKAFSTISFLAAIAFIIILLACINYTNLATARFSTRAREVGIRKTLGASRFQVAGQFWSESLLLTIVALIIALFAAELALPAFNSLTNKQLSLFGGNPFVLPIGLGIIVVLVSIIAGMYPAVFLSSFKPVTTLRGALASSSKSPRISLRSLLVVLQFSFSIVMIIGTLVVSEQMSFIHNKNMGFDRQQVVVVQMRGTDDYEKRETLKAAFRNVSDVQEVSLSSAVPGKSDLLMSMPIEFKYLSSGDKDPNIKWLCIDEGFLPLYGISLKEGRNINNSEADESEAFLLNEAAVRKLKWEQNAIGHEIGYSVGEKASNWWIHKQGRVVGVVKDFHVGTLRKEIEPLLIHVNKQFSGTLSVKLHSGDPRNALTALEAAWKQIVPARPFEYAFLDEDFSSVYKREEQLRAIVTVFAALAIVISCLGLLGLTAFAAEVRTKEIGIRKVLGATIASIVGLLSKDFLKLVLAAILLASPAAYWLAGKWLQDFAYRIELRAGLFVAAGAIAMLIAFATVAAQAISAARANPVQSLRSE